MSTSQLATKMVIHGRIVLFDLEHGDWDEYPEIFQAYLEANKITEGAKKELLFWQR